MWSGDAQRGIVPLLILAVALVAWGGVGLWQGLHAGFTGGLYDTRFVVPEVPPGGLAEQAGFKAGDRVLTVEGVPVERLGMESRWPRALRPRVGQAQRFVVDRNGTETSVVLVYPPPFEAAVHNRIAAFILGLAFLACGVWASATLGSVAARRLASIGLASGVATFLELGPGLGFGITGHIATAASVLMYMLLLDFFVTFPVEKRVHASRLLNGLAVGIWCAVVAFLVAEIVVHPRLYYTTGSVVGPLIAVYALLILVALGHTWWTTPATERRAAGVNVILAGFAIAIGWTVATMAGLVQVAAWVSGLVIAVIPVTMAIAVRRQSRRAPHAA
jgi:hypothetical protein